MKKFAVVMVALFALGVATSEADLKGFLRNKGQSVKNNIENKIDRKINSTVDDAVDSVLDGKKKSDDESTTDDRRDDTKSDDNSTTANPTPTAKGETVKSDFVPGTVVIFEDDFENEQLGEFPSKWDLLENNAEVAKMNGKKAIRFEHGSDTYITPLLIDGNRKYLPEVYTLEFDFFITGEEDHSSQYRLNLNATDDSKSSDIHFGTGDGAISWAVAKPNTDDVVNGNTSLKGLLKLNSWNHFALSFNKRALKVYINDKRVINIPNAAAADWFTINTEFWEDHIDYITNVRLAKGGVELYDRNAQSMTAVEKSIAATGKFVTHNILFATGKADLLPESMEEIQKVAEYMKKNPSVRFEVQGHTDNQGSDKVNDPLSQQRAEAVVKALVELGVDDFNLKAVGKGSHEPIADNGTADGRAQNRRVEFIKR